MKYMIKKIIIGTAIGILLFLFRSAFVVAAVDPMINFTFLGKSVEDRWVMAANGSLEGTIQFNNTNYTSYTMSKFAYVDVCTNGYEPTLWILSNSAGIIQPSSKWYKVDMPCWVGPDNQYRGDVYRQILYITDSDTTTTGCLFDNNAVSCSVNVARGRLYSNTDYTTNMRLLHAGTSYDAPINDLIIKNDYEKLEILNEILTELRNTNQNQTLINAVNNQTNKIIEGNTTNKEIKDFLKDNSTPNNSDYNFDSYNEDNGVITNLLTLPITLTQGVLNGLNNGCTSYNFGSIKGQNISFPCINPGQHLGIAWNIIDIVLSGVFIFIFGKKCITIFNDVTNLRSNQVDEVFK